MARKKISTTVYLTQEQTEALKSLSERTRVPFSVYVREGIDLVLSKYVFVFDPEHGGKLND